MSFKSADISDLFINVKCQPSKFIFNLACDLYFFNFYTFDTRPVVAPIGPGLDRRAGQSGHLRVLMTTYSEFTCL